jgi:hypothetical protein
MRDNSNNSSSFSGDRGGIGTDLEPINDALREHSLRTKDWEHRETISLLHEWAQRFNSDFDLGLQTPAIFLDRIRTHALGTYHPGRNGFGLKHQVTLNTKHLDRPIAELLATLFHEMLHEWQVLYGSAGSGSYHNRQFRNKALLFGLVVDERGCHHGILSGKFTNFLEQHGVATTSLRAPGEITASVRQHGNSRMRKYRCICTTVRCATHLIARCEKCGMRFEEAPPAW